MNNLLKTLVVMVQAHILLALTTDQLKNACHCDLTSSFCDFDCCCDTDCSATIESSCFNELSSTFCIQTQYYFRISPELAQSTTQNCFYFNSSQAVEQQHNISTAQISEIISSQTTRSPLPNSIESMYFGYETGNNLGISGYFVDGTGQCVATGSTNGYVQYISFGQNINIVCSSSNNNINLFSNIFGKSINKYYKATKQKITIPSPSQTYTEATLYFIIGSYGSQQLYYIQDIRVSSNNISNSSSRKVQIKFINPKKIEQQEGQPSFFPQIPYDIFFPIQQYFFKSPF